MISKDTRHVYRRTALCAAGKRLCLVVLIVATACCSCEAAPAAGEDESPSFSELRLSASADQKEYLLGQPIAVYIELANPHEKPVKGHEQFGWFLQAGTEWSPNGQRMLQLELSRDGAEFRRYLPSRTAIPFLEAPPATWIPAGSVWQTKILLTPGDEKATALQGKGKARIRAVLWNVGHRDNTTSDIVEVVIRAPEGMEANAHDYLMAQGLRPLLGRLYWYQRSMAAETVTALREFIRKFPNSAYAGYASFALAQKLFYDGHYVEAEGLFKRVREEFRQPSLADDALFLAAECRFQLGDLEQAERAYTEVVNRYPNTALRKEAGQMLAKIEQQLGPFRNDPRLEVMVTYEAKDPISWAVLVREISRQTAIPLSVDPRLVRRTIVSIQNSKSLREFMRDLTLDTHWIPDGEGYRLVPAPEKLPPDLRRKIWPGFDQL